MLRYRCHFLLGISPLPFSGTLMLTYRLPRCGEPFHELGTSNGDQFGVQTERESLKEPSGTNGS
ncbi:hypothetical protein LINPERHAP1_LOCUS14221 [Linum perenne]